MSEWDIRWTHENRHFTCDDVINITKKFEKCLNERKKLVKTMVYVGDDSEPLVKIWNPLT